MNTPRPVHVALLGAANSIHLQRWAIALQQCGRQVSVISQQAHLALPLPAQVALHPLPLRGAAGYLLNALALRALLRRLQPDLLHAHYASGYGTLAMLARWRPTLLSVWGSDVYEFPAGGALQAWLLRRNLGAADALASTSVAMAEQTRRVMGRPLPITVTPFGVDLQHFRPGPQRAPGLPLTLGTVKTLATTYGIDLLLEAFAGLRQRLPTLACRLLIVGDGPQRADLQSLAIRLGIADAVHFAGPVPHWDVPGFLHQLDVYVAPSRQESFGVAVVEAMACGLPVLVSDAGGLPEVVQHGSSGLVVRAGDVAALTHGLQRLVVDADLRSRLAAAARARAESAYGWPMCVRQMLQCQDAAIAAARSR